MGWRRNARATDERTWINTIIKTAGVGDSIFLAFPFFDTDFRLAAAWIAAVNSLTADFIARQKVGGTNLSFYFVEQFPVPAPLDFSNANLSFIVPRVLELTYTSHSMKPFAEDLGLNGSAPFPWDEDRRALLRAELDAKIARLYGLTRDQLRYILDPADIYGPTCPSETFRVLKNNEIAKYGDYRTANSCWTHGIGWNEGS